MSFEFMNIAFSEAENAARRGEVPVGAVLVSSNGQILAQSGNHSEAYKDVTAHAEILVLRAASQHLGTPRLTGCDLYVTLEPCAMCAAAISYARIRRLIFGAYDPKSGGVDHGGRFYNQPTCHHAPEVVGGVDETRAKKLLQDFFLKLR